jgi:tRNA nucleotidyltransferase/poly(A) polymerase
MDLIKKMEKITTRTSISFYNAYIVGGAVRDIQLNRPVKDVDIATNCPMDVLSRNFHTFPIGQSKDFGILGIAYEGERFEVAQFRADGVYKDGRRPESVEIVSDAREDMKRRDFTVNALAMNSYGQIVDVVGGLQDIKDKVIRAVGDPEERLQEDPVRMIRAARFGSMEGFTIEKKTRKCLRKFAHLIHKVSSERIKLEILAAARYKGPQFARFILLLDDLRLLQRVLPEVHALKYFKHDLEHHPEGVYVYAHTIKCLEIMGDHGYISKLAALFHDVGKAVSFQETYGWKLSYHGHAKSGTKLTSQILNRLKFGNIHKAPILFAVENHMKFHKILDMKPSKVARLVTHPHFSVLVDLAWADEFSRGEAFMHYGDFDSKLEKANEVRRQWEKVLTPVSSRLVDGRRIMGLLNIKPGREVGRIKKQIEDKIINENLDPDDDILIDRLIVETWEENDVL